MADIWARHNMLRYVTDYIACKHVCFITLLSNRLVVIENRSDVDRDNDK